MPLDANTVPFDRTDRLTDVLTRLIDTARADGVRHITVAVNADHPTRIDLNGDITTITVPIDTFECICCVDHARVALAVRQWWRLHRLPDPGWDDATHTITDPDTAAALIAGLLTATATASAGTTSPVLLYTIGAAS